jgi:hypothetical protein
VSWPQKYQGVNDFPVLDRNPKLMKNMMKMNLALVVRRRVAGLRNRGRFDAPKRNGYVLRPKTKVTPQ